MSCPVLVRKSGKKNLRFQGKVSGANNDGSIRKIWKEFRPGPSIFSLSLTGSGDYAKQLQLPEAGSRCAISTAKLPGARNG